MHRNNTFQEYDLISLVGHLTNGETTSHTLCQEANVIIGSDVRCGMRLNEDSIAPRHCIIRYNSGHLYVTDWISDAGTFVNNVRITEETRVNVDDELRLGNLKLRIVGHNANSRPKPDAIPLELNVSLVSEIEAYMQTEFDTPQPHQAATELTSETLAKSDDDSVPLPSRARLLVELAQAQDEITFLRQELVAHLANPSPPAGRSTENSATQLEMDVLRTEVIQLQNELAERDAAMDDPWSRGSEKGTAKVNEDVTDTEALVERLETLLEELQTADRRAATLDDLLRSSADEHRAELDERERLENWVGEIERRVMLREESWQAERNRLELKLASLAEQKMQLDKTLAESPQSATSPPNQTLIVALQQKYDKAIAQLETSHEQVARLSKTLDNANRSIEKAKQVEAMEELMRKRDVEISQERANLARQRAEMDRIRVEFERAPRSLGKADETAIRIQAFRAHLQGIHEQEQTAQKESKAPSLASRIAQLWQRFDGLIDN